MRYFAAALMLLALAAFGGSALAQPRGQVQSLDRIINNIRRSQPGRLLDVRPGNGPAGEPQYRAKWLTPDGRVLSIDTDARTGRVVGVEGLGRGNIPPPRARNIPERPQNLAPPQNRDDDRGRRFRRGQ